MSHGRSKLLAKSAGRVAYVLHNTGASPGRRIDGRLDREGEASLAPHHVQLVLEIVKLGFTAVVLVVIASILS
jgi:hypothetical protein